MVFIELFAGRYSAFAYTESGHKFEVYHCLAGVNRADRAAVVAALRAEGYSVS